MKKVGKWGFILKLLFVMVILLSFLRMGVLVFRMGKLITSSPITPGNVPITEIEEFKRFFIEKYGYYHLDEIHVSFFTDAQKIERWEKYFFVRYLLSPILLSNYLPSVDFYTKELHGPLLSFVCEEEPSRFIIVIAEDRKKLLNDLRKNLCVKNVSWFGKKVVFIERCGTF